MSQPQSTEVWNEEQPSGGFGVNMTPEQFEKFTQHINFLTEETARRERVVADSLNELKDIERVRTYTHFVKEISSAIAALKTIDGTDYLVNQLMDSLHKANDYFISGGGTLESKLETQETLSLHANERTTQ